VEGEENMPKITITETPIEMRWVLQGRLFGPWVNQLRANWRTASRTRQGRTCIVDLNDVTFIDKGAAKLFRSMAREGAQFTANRPYSTRLLQGLKISGKHGLFGMIASFFSPLRRIATVSDISTRLRSEFGKMNATDDAWTRVNLSTEAHPPNSSTPLFKRKDDQDYAS
jgi:hypothetical protein